MNHNNIQAQSELWEQKLKGKTLVKDDAETTMEEHEVIHEYRQQLYMQSILISLSLLDL